MHNDTTRKLTLFTILTEWKENLDKLTAGYFDGFTITEGIGYYRGGRERSARIDIIAEPSEAFAVAGLATAIRNVNAQHSVLVLETDITNTEILDHV